MADRVRSLGVALNAVTIPGASNVNDRLDAETIEIGLGIHGEAGIRQSKLKTADELANIMVKTILEYGRDENVGNGGEKKVVPTFEKGDELAIMINNLGGTSNFEMSILANSVVKLLESDTMGCCKVTRVYVGSFMTAFDMLGASVSIISLAAASSNMSKYLDESTTAPAWLAADVYTPSEGKGRPSDIEYPEIEAPTKAASDSISIELKLDNFEEMVTAAIKNACNKLIESEPMLTKYDTIVGDGDCGLTMERGAKEIISQLESKDIDISHPVPLFESLASAVSASMGGTSGVLLELMFRKMSTFLNSGNANAAIDAKTMKKAFEAGVNAVSYVGGATVGSRTMLDALVPAVNVFISEETSTIEEAAKAANKGAEGTASMGTASAGRSNYLSEDSLTGTPDPGAVAVGLVLTAISEAIKNN
eukprot:720947_1